MRNAEDRVLLLKQHISQRRCYFIASLTIVAGLSLTLINRPDGNIVERNRRSCVKVKENVHLACVL